MSEVDSVYVIGELDTGVEGHPESPVTTVQCRTELTPLEGRCPPLPY